MEKALMDSYPPRFAHQHAAACTFIGKGAD